MTTTQQTKTKKNRGNKSKTDNKVDSFNHQ